MSLLTCAADTCRPSPSRGTTTGISSFNHVSSKTGRGRRSYFWDARVSVGPVQRDGGQNSDSGAGLREQIPQQGTISGPPCAPIPRRCSPPSGNGTGRAGTGPARAPLQVLQQAGRQAESCVSYSTTSSSSSSSSLYRPTFPPSPPPPCPLLPLLLFHLAPHSSSSLSLSSFSSLFLYLLLPTFPSCSPPPCPLLPLSPHSFSSSSSSSSSSS